ncbi:ectonucleoside triphosphate diphosphohydrolase 8-like [Pleurodeles waltl]
MKDNGKGRAALGIILALLIGSAIIALVLSIVNWTSIAGPPGFKYGMVFDAGSSHTSLFVYTWPADKENDTGIVNQIDVCEAPGGGISSYANDPPAAGASLRSCLDKAIKLIPEKQQKETPILLGATAGMRLLRLQDMVAADKVLDEVSKTMKEYPLNFRGARILTGNEEGSLGWITVNYLLKSFVTCSFAGKWVHPSQGETYGAMDLGGASTQMTFSPKVAITNKSTEAVFKLYGYNYTVFTHSYLCYGKDQALKLLLAKLRETQKSSNIDHPCYPTGYTTNITLSSLYNSPCLNTTSGDLTAQITIKGTGDPTVCQNTIQEIFNFAACGTDCEFNVYPPPLTGDFYAFSAFYYIFDFLNLTNRESMSTVRRTIDNFCLQDWNRLKQRFPTEKEDRLSAYCAAGIYIITLLENKYKFNSETWSNIIFAKQAGNADIGWTLGYMLNLTNMIPSEAPLEYIGRSRSLWAASLFFIVLSLVAAIILALLYLCFQRE